MGCHVEQHLHADTNRDENKYMSRSANANTNMNTNTNRRKKLNHLIVKGDTEQRVSNL